MNAIEYKTCSGCQLHKPLADFHSNGRGGHLGRCRVCRSATRKAWRETYRDKQSGYRRRSLLSRYGLTEAEYEAMFAAQGGVCAMCGHPCTTGRRLAVDHCHVSGRVRGLLCVKCNQDLGSYEAVRSAATQYLAEYGTGNPHISHGAALEAERRIPRVGNAIGNARFSEEVVRALRDRYAAGGVTQRELAREYGVSQNAVGQVLRRVTWAHVTP
ncbi:endonuclease domain-containing protein [Streptomyces sp. NPDC094468]|uniref:endonuclease domain-containing protein n=1 Tax=Streptomyces sp. NPDC094468 TaxID=3366066 RepID=UPI00380C80C7